MVEYRTGLRGLCRAFLIASVILMCAQTPVMSECKPFVVDVLIGEPVPMDMVIDDLATVKIIYVGEVHTIDRHHEFQAEMLERLSRRGVKLALGMEMFSVRQQEILDQWQQGNEGVRGLIHALGKGHWTNLMDYRRVLLLARKLLIPILGLNAEDGLVRTVARKGLDGLSGDERAELPPGLEEINPLNDRLLRLKLKVHRAFEGKGLARIILAQALRDATMARAAVDFLESPRGRDRTMMVVAGTGHLNYGFGIPDRVQRRTSLSHRIILPSESGELVLSEAEKQHALPVEITHEDLRFIKKPIADYLHMIPLQKKRPEPTLEPPRTDEARLRDEFGR